MKELSMLSLICSCFYPEPRNMNIYKYDGECCLLEIILQVRKCASAGKPLSSIPSP